MSESELDDHYWLLSKPSGIEQTHSEKYQRRYPPTRVLAWLGAGWHDLFKIGRAHV